ncbi:MAG TPA: sugar transferase [Gemmata sp.]|nr:sugar transferase [Gemmata sp.]
MSHNPPRFSQSTPAHVSLPRDSWPEIDLFSQVTAVRLPVGSGWYAGVKVGLDYAIAVTMLPFAALVVALAAAVVKLTSRGPIFYTQTRLGLNGAPYRIIKLRTMHHNCEAKSGIQWANKNDSRVTVIGRFLRFAHIDELPQLWNVLRGEMSLVGPRPERPEIIKAKGLDQLVPGYSHRLSVKPGVTGLAQVQLPPDSDLMSVRRKVLYDLYYVQNHGIFLDFRLLVATVFKPILGPKALRRLFLLPSRRKITAAIQQQLTRGSATEPSSGLLPA